MEEKRAEQQDLNEDIEVMVHSMVKEIPASPTKGWADHKYKVPSQIAIYWNVRHELSEVEGLIFKERKLVVPMSMRGYMLDLIHESHLGVEKCKTRARVILYWPGISSDITEKVSKCSTCDTYRRRNQREPMISHEIPERPWQKLGTDLCEHKGKTYLVVVNYYSKYIKTSLLANKTAETVIQHLKSIFARHGIPEELISDNMSFNSKEFKRFAEDWGFTQKTSSPTYAQSNGMSENQSSTNCQTYT